VRLAPPTGGARPGKEAGAGEEEFEVDAPDFAAYPRAPSRGREQSNEEGEMGRGVGRRGIAHVAEAVGKLGPPPPSLFPPLSGHRGARRRRRPTAGPPPSAPLFPCEKIAIFL
jgi:hypothetical protein